MRALSRLLLISLLLPVVGSNRPVQTTRAVTPVRPSSGQDLLRQGLRALAEEGKRLATQGRYREAAERFRTGYREATDNGDSKSAARFLVYLANTQLALGEYRQALDLYLEARHLAHTAGDDELVAAVAVNIAWLYRAQGALPEAELALGDALKSADSARFAQGLLLWADLQHEQGRRKEAIGRLEEALVRARQQGDLDTEARILERYAAVLLEEGDPAGAETALLEAYRRLVVNRQAVPALLYRALAELRLAQGQGAAAHRLIARAFEAAQNGPALVWPLFYTRARIRLAEGDPEGALKDLLAATEQIASLRLAYLPVERVRAGGNVGLHEVYDLAVEAAAQLYRQGGQERAARLAFEMAERNRAIALRETLDEFERIRPHLPPEYFETLRELSDAEARLFGKAAAGVRDWIGQLRLRMVEQETAAALRARGKSRAPLAISRPVTAAAVQSKLKPSEALLSFHLGRGSAYLWTLTREQFAMHRLGPSGRLEALVREFRRALGESDAARVRRLGAELGRVLFSGLSTEVRRRPDWILLVDRALFELPFAALVISESGNGASYLVEQHSLRLLPSGAMLLAGPGEAWRGPMVAVGDPVYNRADPRWREEDSPGSIWRRIAWRQPSAPPAELARLAGSAKEVEKATAAYRSPEPPILLKGPRASRSSLLEALAARPAVIHLATHVVSSEDDPSVGRIVLSLRRDGAPESVGMDEVAALGAHPALVVMTGCHSGGGALLPGEGLWGLARAWLRSGAGAVAATLWPVPDHSGELIERFYRYLGADASGSFAQPPERALRRAQMEMIRAGDWRSRPAHWAAFVLMSRK